MNRWQPIKSIQTICYRYIPLCIAASFVLCSYFFASFSPAHSTIKKLIKNRAMLVFFFFFCEYAVLVYAGTLISGTHCSRIFSDCDKKACRLQSPNFPGVYPRNLTCYYAVRQVRTYSLYSTLVLLSYVAGGSSSEETKTKNEIAIVLNYVIDTRTRYMLRLYSCLQQFGFERNFIRKRNTGSNFLERMLSQVTAHQLVFLHSILTSHKPSILQQKTIL